MISPKREWIEFASEDNKIEKLKEWKLVSSKASVIKQLYYKGAYTDYAVECDVAGYVDDNEIVLNINGQLHSIHPDYFIDMQKKERFIIVDIETPMSFNTADGIREVAAVVVEDYRVIDTLHLAIINDEEEYKKGYGHGLDPIEENDELRNKFKALISKYKCPIVAHNAVFDRRFLKHWNWVDSSQEFYCSRDNIKSKVKLESYKMEYLLNYYGIKQQQAHNALDDIMDLLEILKKVKIDKWSTLGSSVEGRKPSKSKVVTTESTNKQTTKSSRSYKNDKEKREEDKKKLEMAKENILGDKFKDKKMVFTGDMKEDRTDMQVLAIQQGATTTTSISGKTNILVIGEGAGASKLSKAKELGIEIITEEDFWNIINN